MIKIIPQLDSDIPEFGKTDLTRNYKKTLGDYLARITEKNEFPIEGGITENAPISIDGIPAPLVAPENAGAKRTYFDTFKEVNKNTKVPALFQKYSNSGYLDTNSSPFNIRKGKSSDTTIPSGEELMREVDEKLDESSFAKRVQEVLKDNNRFNASNPFIPTNQSISTNDSDDNVSIGIVQKEFGVHYPRKNIDAPSKASTNGNSVHLLKIKDLKKLGALTMLKASGEVYAPTNPNNIEQDIASRGVSLLPGLARIGQKIPVSKMSVKNIMAEIDPAFKKVSSKSSIETKEVYSYGNVNSYLVPFTGLSSASSAISAGILTTAVVAILKSVALAVGKVKQLKTLKRNLSTITTTFAKDELEEGTLAQKRKRRLGSFLNKNGLFELDINTTPTYHDYFRCVDRGTEIFFGLSNGINLKSIAGSATQIAKSNGFYNVILRNIVRNITDEFINSFGISLGNIAPQAQFGTANPGFSKTDVGNIGFPLDPVALVNKINNSALLKFINIIASIGDNALLLDKQGYDTSSIDNFDVSDISEIDNINSTINGELNLGVLQAKDRISDRSNTLAWSSNTTPSLYWFPSEILSGSNTYFGTMNNGVVKALGGINDQIVMTSSLGIGRIPNEDVAIFENRLDAQYMPFYFHDLRTNEIISFHAFLENITDNFSVDYEDTTGYGRVGKVSTYKNTDRNIGLTFYVISTNPQDFDQMWWKINKLTTLIYPQYSEGRRLKVDSTGEQFIQPFSQIPTSSPLIRLRLGDLFKTNYSKFGLARLFGVSSPWFKVSQNQPQFNLDIKQFQTALGAEKRRMNNIGGNDRFRNGEYAILKPNGQPGVNGTKVAYPRVPNTNKSNFSPSDILSIFGKDARGLLIYYSAKVKIIEKLSGLDAYKIEVDNANPGQEGQFIVPGSDLYADAEQITLAALKKINVNLNPNTNANTPVRNFFSTENNVVFKSFETTKGKGLAGFIRSIDFDYNNMLWNTDTYYGRAPQGMKITIDFSPINDIQPGIDNHGFNTAPIFPVGNIIKNFNRDDGGNSNTTNEEMYFNKSRAGLSQIGRGKG